MTSSVKVEYKGLIEEKLPSGHFRYRVRPEGDPKRRIKIFCDPQHADFSRQYKMARAGEQPEPLKLASEVSKPETIGWLVNTYLEYLEKRVTAGTTSAKTVKKKRNLFTRLLKTPEKKMQIPREKLIEMQDDMAATPAPRSCMIGPSRGNTSRKTPLEASRRHM